MKSRNILHRIAAMAVVGAMAAAVAGCGGAKLSTANEQLARGEYSDAAKTTTSSNSS